MVELPAYYEMMMRSSSLCLFAIVCVLCRNTIMDIGDWIICGFLSAIIFILQVFEYITIFILRVLECIYFTVRYFPFIIKYRKTIVAVLRLRAGPKKKEKENIKNNA